MTPRCDAGVILSLSLASRGDRRARHCTGTEVGGGGSSVLAQAVTHARQTSIVTSRPARRNYKTGRAAAPGAPASGVAARRSEERAAARPRRATGAARTVGGVTTLVRRRSAASAGAGTRARDERRLGARAQVLWARQPPRAGAAPPASRTALAPLSHAPKRPIYLPCMLALLPEDVAQGVS